MMPRSALRLLALALLTTLATGASCQTPEPLVLSACDSTDEWTGGTLVADPVKEGGVVRGRWLPVRSRTHSRVCLGSLSLKALSSESCASPFRGPRAGD